MGNYQVALRVVGATTRQGYNPSLGGMCRLTYISGVRSNQAVQVNKMSYFLDF